MDRYRTASPVLVTGATGFVGTHLVQALLGRGAQVRAMGRNADALAGLAALGAEPVRVDLRERDAVIDACRGVAVVYHVGALSAPWGPRAEFEAINVGGTAAVMEGCQRYAVGRLIYVSSPSVVFDGRDQVNLPDDAPYPSRPISVYSETKKRGEEIVRAAGDAVPTVIIRPKAVFGPGDTSLLPRLIAAARSGRLPLIGDGTNRVDLTYVENVVHALLLAAHSEAAVGNTYTVTNGDADGAPRLWDVIQTVLSRLGVENAIRRRVPLGAALGAAALMEARATVTGREPMLTRYTVQILARTQTYDISRARRDLGYAPLVSLEEGIERAVAAFRGVGGR